MKRYSGNEYAESWIGTPKQQSVLHSPSALDSRAHMSMELLKCAVRSGVVVGSASLVATAMCDLSEAIHDEWKKREWTIPMPPMEESEDGPVGFEGGR